MSVATLKYLRHKSTGICPLCCLPLDFTKFDILLDYRKSRPYKKLPFKRIEVNINVDHIKPLSKGGKDKRSNKQLVHTHCNTIKADNEISTIHELNLVHKTQLRLPLRYL